MAKRNLLAFDLGASNGRAILGRFDGERLEMEELHRFETPSTDLNGVLYWDAPAIFTHMKGALAKFAALDQGPLQGLGIDTWGVDYGLLDKNGNLLGLPRCYRDATDQDVEAVHRIVPQRTLFQRTGINAMNYNTAYQLYRRKREGDGALSAAKTLLFMPDLLGYFLTGEKATEYTIATT
ncbi:MAG: rhamnulokinase, partial [Clostridiales bacterium]